MKFVRFENGDWFVELTAAGDSESADVRFDVQGTTLPGDVTAVTAYLPADEARKLAVYIIEMAEEAEAQQETEKAEEARLKAANLPKQVDA